jgi:GAF domain-containing protein
MTERATPIDPGRGMPAHSRAPHEDVLAWAGRLVDLLLSEHMHQLCSVFVLDRSSRALWLAAQNLDRDADSGDVLPGRFTIPLEGSICGRVARTGDPVFLADITLDPEYLTYPGSRARSELAVPVFVDGVVVAVVNVESPQPAAYGIADLERLTAVAATAAASFPISRWESVGAI